MPQCCYLAKGAKRPSHTTNMQIFSNKSSFYILAVTSLKASNLNSAVWDRVFIFCCMNGVGSQVRNNKINFLSSNKISEIQHKKYLPLYNSLQSDWLTRADRNEVRSMNFKMNFSISVAYINLKKFQNDSPKKWKDLSNSFADHELCNLKQHEVKYFWRNVFLYFVYF